jgi:hypothetical protein
LAVYVVLYISDLSPADFAWLESDLPAKLAQRPMPASEPMFCLETALKMLCWSWVVYVDGDERQELQEACGGASGASQAEQLGDNGAAGMFPKPGFDMHSGSHKCSTASSDSGSSCVGGPCEEELGLATALGLYGFEHHRVLWGPQHDAKALLGWGAGTVVCCFRGTVSMRNLLSNMKVRRR